MKGLLYKEFYSLVEMSNFKLTVVFMLVSLIFGAIGVMPFMLFFIPIVMAILPRSVMMYDENCKWQQFSLVLPYSRRDIVTAKYITTLSVCAASSLTSVVAYSIASIIKGSFNMTEVAFIGLVGCALALLIPSLALPLELKFGTAKAKYATMLIGGLLGCGGGMLAGVTGTDLVAKLTPSGVSAAVIPVAAITVGLVIFALSWFAAVKLYETREF